MAPLRQIQYDNVGHQSATIDALNRNHQLYLRRGWPLDADRLSGQHQRVHHLRTKTATA